MSIYIYKDNIIQNTAIQPSFIPSTQPSRSIPTQSIESPSAEPYIPPTTDTSAATGTFVVCIHLSELLFRTQTNQQIQQT